MKHGHKPMHFDRAAVFAAYETAETMLAEQLAADPLKSPEQKLLELAGAPLRRAMTEFIIDAKESGIRHELIATIVGAHLAQLAAQAITNWTCACVPLNIVKAFEANLAATIEGRAATVDGGTTFARHGGRA